MIFNIQRFSTHDGDGIRTIIFYKGCTLRCRWCSNPESQSFLPEIMYDRALCKNFAECKNAEPFAIHQADNEIKINRAAIRNIENLREICFSKALKVTGIKMSLEEIISEIQKDVSFYNRSKGGVTLSGGEPLAQAEEVSCLLDELKRRNIDVAIETSLHVDRGKLSRCIGYGCSFLADLKHINHTKFREYTGGDLSVVLTNLEFLVQSNEKITVRIPVIPHFNQSFDEMKQIIDYVISLKKISEIHFIPYHKLGIAKYTMLGREYKFNPESYPDTSEIIRYSAYAEKLGLVTKTGG